MSQAWRSSSTTRPTLPLSDDDARVLGSRLLAAFKDVQVLERLCNCGPDSLPSLTSLKATLLEVGTALEDPEDRERLRALLEKNGDE